MSEEVEVRRATQNTTKNFVDQYMQAVVAKRNKENKKCVEIVSKALTEVESDAVGYSGRIFLGDVLLDLGEGEKALEQFKKCLEIKPRDSLAMCKQGLSYLEMNDVETAKECFLSSAMYNSIDNEYTRISRPYYELCILYRKEGSLEKSFDLIAEALSIDETNVFYQCEKLLLGAQMENSFDEALLKIDEIIEVNLKKEDVFAYPYYIKGICLHVKEAYQEAYECITKAFEVRVDYRRIQKYVLYVNRGNYGYMIGEYEQALKDLLYAKELVEKTKKGEFTCFDYDRVGSCYVELGEYEKSMEYFLKAVEMKPLCQFYEHLGNCRMILSEDNEDEYVKASRYYYKALQSEGGLEVFQSYENLGYVSEYFVGSMKGENLMMNMCRTADPPVTLEQVLFLSKEMDFDVMQKNEYDRNLLMYLFMNPNGISVSVIQALLEETEMDIHEVDQEERWNVAHHAAKNPSLKLEEFKFVAEKLEEYEIKELDNLDRSILHIHCSNKSTSLEVLKFFLEKLNVSVEEVDVDGKNSLHYLCESEPENLECIVYLAKKGVKLEEEDQGGKKPLEYLSEEMKMKVLLEMKEN